MMLPDNYKAFEKAIEALKDKGYNAGYQEGYEAGILQGSQTILNGMKMPYKLCLILVITAKSLTVLVVQ